VWLETVLLIEAAAAFWLSVLNVAFLGRVISAARGVARRAGAVVLACVCAGQGMEALLFLWLGDTSPNGWQAVALLMVRTVLLVSMGLISLLLLRARSLRR
jgi:apolipoprotein N-acyltransferase